MSSSRESPYGSSVDNYKRKNYEMFSSGTRQSQKSTMLYKSFPSDCLFCGDVFRSGAKQQFNEMVTKALYSKYSSSQNYYYTKDINEILSDSRSSAVIRYTDFVHFDEEEEYFKRFYDESEYDFKIKTLTEYYKFHNDIARIFVKPAAYTLNRYHDKKRRLDYIRITKMLKEQEEGDGDEKSMKNGQSGHKDFTIADRILDELNLTEVVVEEKKHRRISSVTQNQQPYLRKSPVKQSNKAGAAKKESLAQKTSPPKKIAQPLKPKVKVAHGITSKEVSVSNTILDLNMKLGEIINSRSMNIDGTYFENNEIHHHHNNNHHEPNSNLAHFLDFVSRNGGTAKINSIPGIYATNSKVTKITSPPSTDRLRPESASSTLRQKKSAREDAAARAIPESLSKMSSPNTSKPFAKITPATEKFGQHQQKSSSKGLSKIKNFEEALKIEPQSSLRKGSSNTSLPRDLLDRAISTTNTSRNNDRASLLRGATKASDDRTRQASTYRERPQLYSSMSGRSTSTGKSKGKTKSIERNTKVVDLLLETQEFALDKNVRIQAFPTQAHRNTKSINFDTKTWNQNVLAQSQQLFGKENIRTGSITEVSGSIVQIISTNPVEKDVVKKVEVPKSQEIKKRDGSQGQTPARELVNDYLYKSREQNKSNSRASTKTKLLSSREAENRKSSTLTSSLIQKKMVSHKHTKSDIRLRKPGYNERMDLSSAKGSTIDGRRGKPFDASLLRTSGSYGQANVFSIALNAAANPDIKSYTLRSERQVRQEEPPTSERSGASRMTKARSPENTLSKKYSNNQNTSSKKGAMTHREGDYRTSEYSPLRVVNRENIVTNQSRILTERSPPNILQSSHRRLNSKGEFEFLRKDLKFDDFEAHSKSKEKKVQKIKL